MFVVFSPDVTPYYYYIWRTHRSLACRILQNLMYGVPKKRPFV